ncbi:hypothetical protein CERSUDRAFT_134024 [Gelatoporia subvermispora B]|uniref:Kinetochore protein Sos7 coiled-coil domain-containing protein n=1 Tax=Ceriporiopsis subvermispora (strain B) TaxID=914234 RepID=M2RK09_CERS8|nr:hypothetical protein CERSUDRAFT_134024 [Gelatoporia subvermispora B]
MVPSAEPESSARLDAARALKTSLEKTPFHLVEHREQFDAKQALSANDANTLYEGRTGLTDPALVAVEVAAQISFLRKLKFQYREQKAKDQYIKTIVSDDAQLITADDNEQLHAANEQKKQALKIAKSQLAEKYDDIRTLAPLVEQDYNKAKALTQEAASLADKILDARLTLTRLRQAHPPPRLTVASATAQLDGQVAEMQTLDEALQEVTARVEQVKERVKDGAREVERLRMQRAELEKQVKAGKDEVEDGRVAGLYDWFTASLALNRRLAALDSYHQASENELHLSYTVRRPAHSGRTIRRVLIKLLFVPNTRRLADAQIDGLEQDLGDLVGAHVQGNDVPGLITAVLMRARAEG